MYRRTSPCRRLQRLEPHGDSSRTTLPDYLFTTRYGNLDVVPELAGSYGALEMRAASLQTFGQKLCVAHVDDLLATLTVPRREKNRARLEGLRELQQNRWRHP